MPTERLCMRHTREILRHKWLLGSSHRLVTSSLAVSHGAITDTTQRALRAGLNWDSVCALLDSELEQLLYPCLLYTSSIAAAAVNLWRYTNSSNIRS